MTSNPGWGSSCTASTVYASGGTRTLDGPPCPRRPGHGSDCDHDDYHTGRRSRLGPGGRSAASQTQSLSETQPVCAWTEAAVWEGHEERKRVRGLGWDGAGAITLSAALTC